MTYYIKRTAIDTGFSVYLSTEPGEMKWSRLRPTGILDYQYHTLFKCEQYPVQVLAMLKENCSKNYKGVSFFSFEAVEVTSSYAIYICGRGCCNKPGFAVFHKASDFMSDEAHASIYLRSEEDVIKDGWYDSQLFETRAEAEELTPLLERLFPGAEISIQEVTININETNSTP